MSVPGWYPDPAGVPGRVRYWDGTAWTDRTAAAPSGADPQRPDGGGAWGWLVGVVALIIVVSLVAFVLTRPGGSDAVTDAPVVTTSPTITGWDEAPSPTPTPTPPPSPTEESGDNLAECSDDHSDVDLGTIVRGDRLQVGGISMPVPDGWTGPHPDARVRYTRGGMEYLVEIEPAWANAVMIGATDFDDDIGAAAMAETITRCMVGSSYFGQVDEKLTRLATRQTTVSGYPAAQVDATFRWSAGILETTRGSAVRVIVVMAPDHPYFFLGEATIERPDMQKVIDETAAGLEVD